jgi:hypothetical protein
MLSSFERHSVIKTILSGQTHGKIYAEPFLHPRVVFAQFKHRTFITDAPKAMSPFDLQIFSPPQFLRIAASGRCRFLGYQQSHKFGSNK